MRKKIANIVGARPNFVKVALIINELKKSGAVDPFIIHTGQHYDYDLSGLFFKELKIPSPRYNLGVGSASHGRQTAAMIRGIEKILVREKPDIVVVYGDTNSTLAGALAAAKLGIKIAHVEAGLRSFNMNMPEEINRVATDSITDVYFCPTRTAAANLRKEGKAKGVYLVGDVMYDSIKKYRKAVKRSEYILCTIHRVENTDDPGHLRNIFNALGRIKDTIILPLHPRTKKYLKKYRIAIPENIKIVRPVSYLEMLDLEKSAKMIITDSGGVQKEAFIFNVPCVTLRNETEWVETVQSGANYLTGANTGKILSGVEKMRKFGKKIDPEKFYGDGMAHRKIANILKNTVKG